MGLTPYLDCKVYVDADIPHRKFVETVADLLSGSTSGISTVSVDRVEMDVLENDEFDASLGKNSPDGFLYYRYYIDVFPPPGEREPQIAVVSGLLEHLWALGFEAVAACDYEDMLPRKPG